jgi:cystine transport system substrate-binding protein
VLRPRKRLCAGIFLLGTVALTVLIPAASADHRRATLRANDASVSRAEQRTLLELYSLETQLARARARVASVARRQVALQRLGETLQVEAASVTQSMDDAQTELQQQLRALYEQPSPDPIAVVLGAQSLDDAVTSLDNLRRVSQQSHQLLDETVTTRAHLATLLARLDSQREQLAGLRAVADAEAARLDSAAAERRATIAALERQRTVNRAALAALDTRAVAAAHTTLTSAAPAASTDSNASTVPAGDAPATGGGRTLTVVATAYALTGSTASGLPVGPGIAAVDPSVIPLGARFDVPGYGVAVAADTGPGIQGSMIDLWFATDAAARAWGRRTVTITFK